MFKHKEFWATLLCLAMIMATLAGCTSGGGGNADTQAGTTAGTTAGTEAGTDADTEANTEVGTQGEANTRAEADTDIEADSQRPEQDSIGNYAFAYCYGLTDVYFTGTEEEWNAIKGHSVAAIPENATIHYVPKA